MTTKYYSTGSIILGKQQSVFSSSPGHALSLSQNSVLGHKFNKTVPCNLEGNKYVM